MKQDSEATGSAFQEQRDWEALNDLKKLGFDPEHPHRGYLYDRTQINFWEAAFAREWEERAARILPVLLDYKLLTTPRENFVIATFVQWLGTNVGSSFLQTCLTDCGTTIIWPHRFAAKWYLATRSGDDDRNMLIAELLRANFAQDAKQLLFDLCEPT